MAPPTPVTVAADGSISLNFILPWKDIKAAYQQALYHQAQSLEIKGFRKGKAPLSAVKAASDQTKLYQQAFAQVFSAAYAQAITKHHLQPLLVPQVQPPQIKAGQDWPVQATTAQAPVINLGDYQHYLKGKKKLEAIFDTLLQHIQFSVSPLLVNQAKNHALSRLLDQVNQLGLTINQYLASKNLTSGQLQADYATTAQTNLQLEFILQAIAADLNIKPSPTSRRQTLDALLKL